MRVDISVTREPNKGSTPAELQVRLTGRTGSTELLLIPGKGVGFSIDLSEEIPQEIVLSVCPVVGEAS